MRPDKERVDVRARLNDRQAMSAALHEAAEEARQRHNRAGVPMATWRDGRVVLVNPADLSEIKAQRDTA